MSIVRVSCLSGSDLVLLGNNLAPAARKDRREIKAVNRSLAVHDETVGRLFRRPLAVLRRAQRRASLSAA